MAYIYCADIWCDECGADICERIKREVHAPKHPDDEHTYDSDEYPKHADDDAESDCPQHCAAGSDCFNAIVLSDGGKVGCLIGNVLTQEGVKYVRDEILDDLQQLNPGDDPAKSGRVTLEIWLKEFADYDILEELDFSEVFDKMSDALSNGGDEQNKTLAEIHNKVCSRRIIPWGEDSFVYIE